MAKFQRYSVALLDQVVADAGGYIGHLLAPAAATNVKIRIERIVVDAAAITQFRVGYASAVAANGTAALPASNPQQSTRTASALFYKDTAVIDLTEDASDTDLRAASVLANTAREFKFEDVVLSPGGSIYIFADGAGATTGSINVIWTEESRP